MENLVYSLAIYFFHTGGDRSLHDPDPIKPFKTNRVPANANNCLGLASRIKKPATSAGDLVWRVSRRLCHASETRGATRRAYLCRWFNLHNHCTIVFLYMSILAIIGWAL